MTALLDAAQFAAIALLVLGAAWGFAGFALVCVWHGAARGAAIATVTAALVCVAYWGVLG